MMSITDPEIQSLIESVGYSEALTITATEDDVRRVCKDARSLGFRAVVAFPQYVGVLVRELEGSEVRAQIPIAFPCGGNSTATKCAEAREGLDLGATDLDMVMNLAAFRAGEYARVEDDIGAVLDVARPFGVPFKVIIEIGVLDDAQIVRAADLVARSGADFVKTCTGFGPGRVSLHAVSLIKNTVGERIGIKASGGVAGLEDGIAMMRAGAAIVALRHGLIEQLRARGWGSEASASTTC